MRLQVGAILDGAELCQAAFAGNLSYVQMLLQFGANPDAAALALEGLERLLLA